MACATLKRSPEWEAAQLQQPAKRRRCAPFASTSSSPSTRHHQPSASPVASPFAEPQLRITPDQLVQEICDEIKRLQRRKQLRMSVTSRDSDGSSSGSEGDSPRPAHSRVLFTFKQVRMICERMLREQEAALRAEYEAALSGRLAEQYESFVRFNLDQVQRRPLSPQNISYLS